MLVYRLSLFYHIMLTLWSVFSTWHQCIPLSGTLVQCQGCVQKVVNRNSIPQTVICQLFICFPDRGGGLCSDLSNIFGNLLSCILAVLEQFATISLEVILIWLADHTLMFGDVNNQYDQILGHCLAARSWTKTVVSHGSIRCCCFTATFIQMVS